MAATFSLTASGDLNKTSNWLKAAQKLRVQNILNKYGQIGCSALAAATPSETGLTAASWGYNVTMSGTSGVIEWFNTNEFGGFNIALGLQYGHGTGTGGYVPGRDYINPAIQPVMDKIAEDVMRELSSL